MLMIGIDVGTTNSKVGVMDAKGKVLAIASRPTISYMHEEGFSYYDPEQMWDDIAGMIQEVTSKVDAGQIASIGITSMAESGLILNEETGKPQSTFVPWFDTCSQDQARHIAAESDPLEQFTKSGLNLSFKLGLAKILWIRSRNPQALEQGKWLTVSGYIAYRLSGVMACDYTLAARTYAFDLNTKSWDRAFIAHFGVNPDLFPELVPSGAPLGKVTDDVRTLGLPAHTVVAIAGHDHVSAALAVGAISSGDVYNSMGTAETLVGIISERKLGAEEYHSGLSYGVHAVPGQYFWMGGNSSSGGSVEWIRKVIGVNTLDYMTMKNEVVSCLTGPTGILYYPYLSGCGAPTPDSGSKAAFIGLSKSHGRPQILKALLEGTAYQQEYIRRSAEQVTGQDIHQVRVIGGGTRLEPWMQIKAAVSGVELILPEVEEAAVLGAAMIAAIGAKQYANAEEAVAAIQQEASLRRVSYAEEEHHSYQQFYTDKFVPIQAALRNWKL
ncbi:FGGY family carbohydrate kinase [Paenibacillus terrigena]|uniref:FGGY-family carbohydrate kinase n=1 Tax=Paenibacillus terrigena TaxID=369333 RepID=UPI0028D8D74B|nr:FGGY family carbohydrate kinase [Paenibacillus terrigena]